jgi:hypothetical protein
MSVPSDSVSVTYALSVYNETSPQAEFGLQVSSALNIAVGVTQDDLDGYARAGMQAIADAVKADFPTLTISASCRYDRQTAGTPVIGS